VIVYAQMFQEDEALPLSEDAGGMVSDLSMVRYVTMGTLHIN
jgi:hypothetical protein